MSDIEKIKERQKQALNIVNKKDTKKLGDASVKTDSVKKRQTYALYQTLAKKVVDKKNYYESLKSNPDWEEKSQISALNEEYNDFIDGYGVSYWFKNGIIETADEIYNAELVKKYLMDDDQKAIYNYLYQTDKDKAQEYYGSLESELGTKFVEGVQKLGQKVGEEDPWKASLVSFISNTVTPLAPIADTVEGIHNYFTEGEFTYDTDDALNAYTYLTNSLREGTKSHFGNVGDFVYDVGMSMGDSVIRNVATWGKGGHFVAMGQAQAQGVIQGKELGMSDGKALLYGTILGVVEGLTEKFTVGKLLDKTALAKNIFGYLFKEFVAEASEEVVADLADKITQMFLAGDEAEWRREYQYYLSRGYDETEALTAVIANTAGDLGKAALAGGLSGGIMGGGYAGINTALNIPTNIQSGRELALGANAQSELIEAARAADTDKLTKRITKLQKSSGAMADYQRGRLARQTMEEAFSRMNPYSDFYSDDAKKARKAENRLERENERRAANGMESVAEEFKNSEFGKRYAELQKRIKDYEEDEASRNTAAVAQPKNAYEVSEDGKTYFTEKGADGSVIGESEVSVSEISALKDGVVYVRLSDGRTVSAESLQLPEEVAELYSHASTYNGTATARAFTDGYEEYKKTNGSNPTAYAELFKTAYMLGLESNGRSVTEMISTLPKSKRSSIIKLASLEGAFLAGRTRAEKLKSDAEKMKKARDGKKSRSYEDGRVNSKPENSEKVNTAKKKSGRGGLKISDEVDTKKLSATQRAAIKRLELLSEALGINVVVKDEGAGANGVYEGGNGSYNTANDTLYVNVNAGRERVGGLYDFALVETLSHELIHYIKAHSASDYASLLSFLRRNIYSDAQWSALVRTRLEQYREKKGNSDFTYEEAEEEVVANAFQSMLDSPRVILALAGENLTLFRKIKLRIASFFEKLISRLNKFVNYSVEARAVIQSTKRKRKELEARFVRALRGVNDESEVGSFDTQSEGYGEEKLSVREEDSLDNYTESQYNRFGWARYGEAISSSELDDLYSKIMESKSLSAFKRSSRGEYIVEVNDKPHTTLGVDNVFVFVKGTRGDFYITRVVRFDADTETEMEIIKEVLYEGRTCSDTHLAFLEQQKFATQYAREGAESFGEYQKLRKSGEESRGAYSDNRGSEEYRGGYSLSTREDGSITEKFSLRERVETYSREMLASAFESIAENKRDRRLAEEYRLGISRQEELISQRRDLLDEKLRLRGVRGSEAAARRSELNTKIKSLSDRIAESDAKLLEMQNSKPLREAFRLYIRESVERERIAGEMYYGHMMERLRERHKRELKEQKEKARRQSEASQKRKDVRRSKEKISELYKKYSDMLTKSKNSKADFYVPQYLIGPMADILGVLDFDSGVSGRAQLKRDELKGALERLSKAYSELKSDELYDYNAEYDAEIAAYFDELVETVSSAGTANVYEMDGEALGRVLDILSAVDASLTEAKELIHKTKAANIRAAVDNIVKEETEIAERLKIDSDADIVQKGRDSRLFGKAYNKARSVARSVKVNTLSPNTIAREICGYDESSQFYTVWNEFGEGKRRASTFSMKAHKLFDDVTSGKWRDAYLKSQTKLLDVGLKDVSGNTVEVTRQMLCQILLSVEREERSTGLDHIFHKDGGLEISDARLVAKGKYKEAADNSKLVRPTAENIKKMRSLLNDFDREYMERARAFYNVQSKEAVNETSLKVLHREIAKETAYIQFEVDKRYLVSEVGSERLDAANRLIRSYGMTKELSKNAHQPIIISGLDYAIERHIDVVSRYVGYATAVKDFNKIWNSRVSEEDSTKLSKFMSDKFGAKKIKVLTDAIADLQSERSKESNIFTLIRKTFVPAKLILNFSTVIKQYSSINNSFAVLKHRDPISTAICWLTTALQYKNIYAEIDEYTPAHWERRQGLSTSELGDLATKMTSTKRLLEKRIPLTPISAKSFIDLIQNVDCITAATIWRFAKSDVAKMGYTEGTEEYKNAVVKLYEKALNETQATYDVMNRPEILRGGGAMRALTLFRTEDFKRMNMLYESLGRAGDEMRSGKGASALKGATKTIIALVRSMLAFALATALGDLLYRRFDDYTDDEGNFSAEKTAESIGDLLIQSVADTILPIAGGALTETIDGAITGDYFYGDDAVSIPVLDFVNQVLSSYRSFSSGFEWERLVKSCSLTLELFTGIPALNIEKLIEAVRGHISAIKK